MQSSDEVTLPSLANATLRRATKADCWQVYRWRNLPEIVALGTSQRRVWPWEHWLWFREALARDHCLLWIILAPDADGYWVDCGMVRIDRHDVTAGVSIYLLPGWTGKGIGPTALKRACARAFGRWGPVCAIVACIREDNEASIRAFDKAGFVGTAQARWPWVQAGHKELILWRTS